MLNRSEVRQCLPSLWSFGPLAGDEWARQNPEEDAADVARAEVAKQQLYAVMAEKHSVPISLVFATQTKREHMNEEDRKFRQKMEEEDEDEDD